MRSYSLTGTRPARTSLSVPRLMAPNSERTWTSPASGASTVSSRSSARPGATYQSALPCILVLACRSYGRSLGARVFTLARFMPSTALDLTPRRYIVKPARKSTQSPFMLERSSRDELITAAAPAAAPGWRPALFFLCVGLTMAGLIWLAVIALSPGGLNAIDLLLVVLFSLTLPWYVICFLNAAIGLLIMRFARDPAVAVLRVAGRVRGDEPITTSTAILVCTRNEPPEHGARMLEPMLQGLTAHGVGECFHVYVLSDSSDEEIAAGEDACFATLTASWRGRVALTYRRRSHHIGFKAGNVADFCARWGKHHDFAILLDADSVMT